MGIDDTIAENDMVVFRVLPTEETRIDVDGETLGLGVRFPSGACYVDWNREVFPEDDRLDHPHVSVYGSFADVEQGTGGCVFPIAEYEGYNNID